MFVVAVLLRCGPENERDRSRFLWCGRHEIVAEANAEDVFGASVRTRLRRQLAAGRAGASTSVASGVARARSVSSILRRNFPPRPRA